MKAPRTVRCLVSLAVFVSWWAAVSAKEVGPPWSITPVPRRDAWWHKRHAEVNARVKQGNVELIMIGDSITHYWERAGKKVWKRYYEPRQVVNLGFGGDGVEHVLWRLDHGNLDGISPKLAVLLIGTNNAGSPAEKIAEGVKRNVEKLRARLPNTKILVLAILPRGAEAGEELRQKVVKTNEILSKLADNQMVFFLDIGKIFLNPDGTMNTKLMPDLVHPNAEGYSRWAEAMEPTVSRLMGEKCEE